MEGQLAVPLHFAAEFLVLVVAIGAALDALRARRHGAGPRALGQAAGFFALAVAQGLHGALIAPTDGDLRVVALRGAGFVLLALTARPAISRPVEQVAATAVAPAVLFLPGADARFALVPAVAALLVAARGFRAHRVDQDPTTFAFTGAFFSLALAEAATALGPADGGAAVSATHALRAIAALFLARWLWTSIVRSVRMRFVAAFAAVLTIGVMLVSGALSVVIGNTLQAEETRRLMGAVEARLETMRELEGVAINNAQFFSQADSVRDAIADPPRRGATAPANLARAISRLNTGDFLLLVDRSTTVIGSAENRRTPSGVRVEALSTTQEIAIAGRRTVGEALGGRPTASIEQVAFVDPNGAPVDQALILGAHHVRRGREVVGAVVVGYRVDRTFLARISEDTGAEATLLVSDRVASTTLPGQEQVSRAFRAIGRPLARAREGGTDLRTSIRVGSTDYITVLKPLRAADSQVVGQLALSIDSAVVASAQRDITRTVFLITLLAVAFAALLAWLSGGRVTKPIRSLTAAARELSAGNYGARARVTSRDEVGALGAAFNDMAAQLEQQTGDLREAATTQATLRARMEAILQSMTDGLIATDERGRVLLFNRAAESMLRRKVDKAVGKQLGDVLTGKTVSGAPLADAALEGSSAAGSIQRGERTTLPVAMTSAPLLDSNGREVGRVVLLRDVSSEVAAERMKSEFLSNVSHELRTPITPIRGYAEILSRRKFTREKTEQFLEGILESTERLERIVEILVDFSSIEAGRLKPRSEALEVASLLDAVTQRWKARGGKHRFVRRGGPGLPPVLGDAKLISRSVNELIDNAVKFSPDGGTIEVIVEASTNGSRRPGKLVITVKDHGIGIEADKMPELFQDFRQGDGSDTRAYGGLGLGLAYVKRIADIHGGDVAVESRPGKGSAFSMVLPAATGAALKGKAVAAAPRRKPVARAKLTRARAAAKKVTSRGKKR